MKQIISLLAISVIFVIPAKAQNSVTVTAIKANLRGTPSMTGLVVSTVKNGESFELIKEKAPWYLVQTPTYVGWLHGNSITLGSVAADESDSARVRRELGIDKNKPRTTTKPLSIGDSPFQREYIGGDTTTVSVFNQTDRTLTLIFGGVTYTVAAGAERSFEAEGGRYEYFASVPRAVPLSGVKEFGNGYLFTWRFFIVRR